MRRLIDMLRTPAIGSALESILIMAMFWIAIGGAAIVLGFWIAESLTHLAAYMIERPGPTTSPTPGRTLRRLRLGPPWLDPEQGTPAEPVLVRSPDEVTHMGMGIGAAAGAVVEHGRIEQLQADWRTAFVPRVQR